MKSNFKITNYNKIAIINTAFIGDVVLSFFLCQSIKNIQPDSKLYFVATPKVKDLLTLVTSIDVPILYDKKNIDKGFNGIINIANRLKKEKVELILSPHRSLRTSLITYLAKPKLSVSYQTSSFSFLYKQRVPYLFKSHEIERNLELLGIFSDFQKGDQLPDIIIEFPKTVIEKVVSLINLNHLKRNIVVIAPGSIWKTKQWIKEGFIFVASELIKMKCEVILIGSDEDFRLCEEISIKTGAKNFAGRTNLAESLYILKNSHLLITNDSSPTHLATIVKCPTITIYGPTIPEFGFYPRAPNSKIVQIEGLECKPCSIHGYNKCPLRHHRCMSGIQPERVLSFAIEMLKNFS
ncbi:MAG: glycosyltransferase family 9 protein [Candidatus Kapaibacteriota bacterium]|jgi:heptosyltransferase-2